MASDFTRSWLKNFLVSLFRIHCLIFVVLLGVLISSIAIPVYADHTSSILSYYPNKSKGMWQYTYYLRNNGTDDIIQVWIDRTENADVIDVLGHLGWEFDDTTSSTKFGWICNNLTYRIIPKMRINFKVNSSRFPSRFFAITVDSNGGEYSQAVWAPDTTPGNDSDGGLWVPVDKFSLLTPYVGAASTILVATAATAIYSKRVKRRKEKQ